MLSLFAVSLLGRVVTYSPFERLRGQSSALLGNINKAKKIQTSKNITSISL